MRTEKMGVRELARLLGKSPSVITDRRKARRPSVTQYEAAWLWVTQAIPLYESRPDVWPPPRKWKP